MKRGKLTVLLIVVILFGYLISTIPELQPPLVQVERIIDAPIPTDAKDILIKHNPGFQGEAFFIRFSLYPHGLSKFLSQICRDSKVILGTEYNAYADLHLPGYPEWWIPEPSRITVSGQCLLRTAGADIEIFVEDPKSQIRTVYIRGGRT